MAEKGRLTLEQKTKTVLFFAETKSVVLTQQRFRAHFHTRWAPCRQTVRRLFQAFQTKGTLLEPKRPRVSTVRTPENIEAVRVAMTRSPSKSTRTLSRQLGIRRSSIQNILHKDLHLFPYKITMAHKLQANDRQRRVQFATWALAQDDGVLHNTWFSDEAYVHLNGTVNKQNIRYWGTQQPDIVHEVESFGPKVCVWAAMSSHGIIGPFFFNDTVNSVRYNDMLLNFFIPQLLARGLPMNTQWFMQDGARPHTANLVLDLLHENFENRVMSNRFPERFHGGSMWPPHSPDLNPCDFFLWGFMKEQIFRENPTNLLQLRAAIINVFHVVTEDLCRKVVNNSKVRLEEVLRQDGRHIEHVLRRH